MAKTSSRWIILACVVLAALLAERDATYRGADAVVETELLETEQVIRAVHELAPTSGAA